MINSIVALSILMDRWCRKSKFVTSDTNAILLPWIDDFFDVRMIATVIYLLYIFCQELMAMLFCQVLLSLSISMYEKHTVTINGNVPLITALFDWNDFHSQNKIQYTFTKNLSRHHSNDFEYLVDTNNYNT